jgi:flagellar motor protein MotB
LAFTTLTVIPSEHYRLAGEVDMAKDPEYRVKETVDEAGKALEKGLGDVASSLRKKGNEFQEYLKKVHAEVEEWKFGVEEAKDGFRVEWRLVALIRRPKKKGEEKKY